VRSVLITGGSGAFGTAFVRHLLHLPHGPELGHYARPKRIVVFSRGEHRQAQMARALGEDERLRFFIGDVRDRDRLRRAMEDIEVVIHAAALKRIEVGQYNPLEVMKTNILGTANVVEAATDAKVSRCVLVSSDKAYQPISPYGTSKAFAESLFLAANNTHGNYGPKFAVVRYGNVWGSTGSVVPLWRQIINEQTTGHPLRASETPTVPVTDPECTRFYMTMDEAVALVFLTAETMAGGEIKIPILPAYRLGDLAEAMGAQMHIMGLPAWEKRHESMGEGNSSDTARRMSVAELREVLR
jgi:UDP-N-acetylglucosamine 4,6-dehydratase/5-epimerase